MWIAFGGANEEREKKKKGKRAPMLLFTLETEGEGHQAVPSTDVDQLSSPDIKRAARNS